MENQIRVTYHALLESRVRRFGRFIAQQAKLDVRRLHANHDCTFKGLRLYRSFGRQMVNKVQGLTYYPGRGRCGSYR